MDAADGAADAAAQPDEGSAGPSPDASQVAGLQAELEAMRDRLARARADYANLQRRVARDADLERDRAKARVLEAFLPLLEMAQMAARQARQPPEAPPGIAEGLEMLAREFERALEREGLAALGGVGQPFDAAVHEAVAEEAAGGLGPGQVARVVRQGYRLGDRVLRHAKVAVTPQGPSPQAAAGPPT